MRMSVSYRKYTPFSYALLLSFALVFSGVAGSNSDSNLESYSLPVSGKTIDIDGNDKFDALTDGLLLLRSMFELSGTPLISGVVADDAVYKSSDEIEARIAALGDRIDIDSDGRIDALTDGLLILRYLFELSGDALTAGVISDGAQRSSAADIELYLLKLTTFGPVFTSSATFSAAENQTSIGTVTATDADSGDSITFAVSGSELAMTSAGVLSFASAPDYETKASYTATVTASDGTNETPQSITVNVTNVNDNSPVFISGATFSAAENQTSIGTVTATDADSGDSITFAVSGSELAMTSAGVLSFASAPDYETKVSYTATVTASDGTNETPQSITVNVTNINDNSPVFTSGATFSAAENQTSIGTVTATDVDSSSITFTISGSDAGSFSISSAGIITFNVSPDYETKNSYAITVNVSDGINSNSQALTINVSDINETPIFTSLPSTLLVDENTLSVVQVKTFDSENDPLTYALSGSDAASFNVSTAGLISFKVSKDFENLSNSRFSITVSISDASLSRSRNVYVMVKDVVENQIGESNLGNSKTQ